MHVPCQCWGESGPQPMERVNYFQPSSGGYGYATCRVPATFLAASPTGKRWRVRIIDSEKRPHEVYVSPNRVHREHA